MPKLTRWSLKLSLLSLLLSLLFNLIISTPQNWLDVGALHRLRPAMLHLFLVGWITQFIFGVANWLFPRASRDRFNPHPAFAWSAFIMLNAGLALRLIAEPFQSQFPFLGAMLVLSGLFQWTAGLLFVVNLWGRIRGT